MVLKDLAQIFGPGFELSAENKPIQPNFVRITWNPLQFVWIRLA